MPICICSSLDCQLYGCAIMRGNKQPPTVPQIPLNPYPQIQKGCICPPGAELTCMRSDCGRKNTESKYFNGTVPLPMNNDPVLSGSDEIVTFVDPDDVRLFNEYFHNAIDD